jgi:drug/metabolite transporter (DMT)-like permease
MPAAALALLLAAAVAHATWNYFAKGATNDLAFNFGIWTVSAVTFFPVGLIAWIVTGADLWPLLGFAACSALIHITYYVLLTRGYKEGDLSLVYPLARGTGPVLAVIGAILIYDERPSGLALAGATMIVSGILVMSWPSHRTSALGRSIMFALLTGACTAGYTLWDKHAIEFGPPVLYGYGIELAGALWLSPVALATAGRRADVVAAFRDHLQPLLYIGILTPAAYIMVLAALSLAPVTYIAPGREISILFGAIIGLRLLGEPDAPRRMVGAGAIVAGIFALAFG